MKRKKSFHHRILKRLKEMGYEPVESNPISTLDSSQRQADVQEFLRKLKEDDKRAREVRIVVQKILRKIEDAHKRAKNSKLHFGVCI